MAGLHGSSNPNYKTGGSSSRPGWYNSWQNMKARCLCPTNPKYERYGARGVTVCEEWLSVDGFKKWVDQSGWEQGLTIDRIDNDGHYCPENCRWVSMSENSRRKRTTKISFKTAQEIRKKLDSGKCEYELAKEYGVVHGTIWFIKNRFTRVPDGECTSRLAQRKARKEKREDLC